MHIDLTDSEHKKPPLVRQDLDALECSNPHCTSEHPVFLYAACHMDSGLMVGYDKKTGCINLYCKQCGTFVARVRTEEATIQ